MRKPVFDQVRHKPGEKVARGLKFRFEKVMGLYYLCSENKGTEQLCDYRTADLRLWFCIIICNKQVFS